MKEKTGSRAGFCFRTCYRLSDLCFALNLVKKILKTDRRANAARWVQEINNNVQLEVNISFIECKW